MPDRAYLHPIDPELVPGARNAINVCLRLKPQERITIITDTATREIAAALQTEVERVGFGLQLICAGASCAASAEIHAGDHSRRSGALAGIDLRRANAARRAPCADANDQCRQQSPNPTRSYGEHQSTNHARRHARRLFAKWTS